MSLPLSEAACLSEAWPGYNKGLKARCCCAAPVEYDYLFSENGLVAYKDGKVLYQCIWPQISTRSVPVATQGQSGLA